LTSWIELAGAWNAKGIVSERPDAVVAQRGLDPHCLRDGEPARKIARTTRQDPVADRMRLFGDKHPRHRAALQLAADKSGYGKKQLTSGRAWGVAVHESFDSVVANVVEVSVQDGRPVLQRVTAGVHSNLAVNPRSVEAQVQGAASHRMCLPQRSHHAQGRDRGAEQLR